MLERSSGAPQYKENPLLWFHAVGQKKTLVMVWFCQSAGLIVGELKVSVAEHRRKLYDVLNLDVLMEKVPFPPPLSKL